MLRTAARNLLPAADETIPKFFWPIAGSEAVDRKLDAPEDQTMSAGELINYYLANGYDMKAIRTMFSDFFTAEEKFWDFAVWTSLSDFHFDDSHATNDADPSLES